MLMAGRLTEVLNHDNIRIIGGFYISVVFATPCVG